MSHIPNIGWLKRSREIYFPHEKREINFLTTQFSQPLRKTQPKSIPYPNAS